MAQYPAHVELRIESQLLVPLVLTKSLWSPSSPKRLTQMTQVQAELKIIQLADHRQSAIWHLRRNLDPSHTDGSETTSD